MHVSRKSTCVQEPEGTQMHTSRVCSLQAALVSIQDVVQSLHGNLTPAGNGRQPVIVSGKPYPPRR